MHLTPEAVFDTRDFLGDQARSVLEQDVFIEEEFLFCTLSTITDMRGMK